jgi:serine protease Do
VRIQDVSDDVAEAIGLEKTAGALVTDVPDGPAKDAGMLSGDVIMSFDGVDVEDTRGLVRTVGNADVGKTVRVIVFREGKTQTLKITLGRREDAESNEAPMEEDTSEEGDVQEMEMLGLKLAPLNDDLREQLELGSDANGLVVTDVDEAAEAFEKGLRAGDVITEAGQQKIATAGELQAQVDAAKEAGRKSLLLLVRRAGEPRFVALTLD